MASYVSGELKLPIVLRASIGSKYGAQHSQDWSSLLTHIPGLSIVYPATPYDAKGLIASSLKSNDPTIFFESQRLYDKVEVFNEYSLSDSKKAHEDLEGRKILGPAVLIPNE